MKQCLIFPWKQVAIFAISIALATVAGNLLIPRIFAQTEISDVRQIRECDMTENVCTILYQGDDGVIRIQQTNLRGEVIAERVASDGDARRYSDIHTIKVRQELIDLWVETRNVELTACQSIVADTLTCVQQMARNQQVIINKLHSMLEVEDIP